MNNRFDSLPRKPDTNTSNVIEDSEALMVFGRLLSVARDELNKTRGEIAGKIGVNQSVIGFWENGISFPTEERLSDIAKAYGINERKLKKAFGISTQARENLKDYKKPSKIFAKPTLENSGYGPSRGTRKGIYSKRH